MEGLKVLAVIALLSVVSLATALEMPFLVVHKKASLAKAKSGVEHITVSIDLYNRGSVTAYDVSLNDNSWPSDMFSVISGNASTTWDKLDPESSVSTVFVLESTSKGIFYGKPAVVKYRVAAKSALQEAYSTPIQPLDLLAESPPEKKYEWAKNLAAKYGPLASVLSIVGLFVYVLTTPSKSSGSKSVKKRR
eukprot:TRINITY_DN2780_c0_g1_i1.p1 TRINITY_DN2780_c0_g1~~TRINITY_DN2780_c0_g1_i1.p1  ORF type:complete len:192 (-),score=31.59 TRINITY_DN2780_c0_g1_i1:252-827(-)